MHSVTHVTMSPMSPVSQCHQCHPRVLQPRLVVLLCPGSEWLDSIFEDFSNLNNSVIIQSVFKRIIFFRVKSTPGEIQLQIPTPGTSVLAGISRSKAWSSCWNLLEVVGVVQGIWGVLLPWEHTHRLSWTPPHLQCVFIKGLTPFLKGR